MHMPPLYPTNLKNGNQNKGIHVEENFNSFVSTAGSSSVKNSFISQ